MTKPQFLNRNFIDNALRYLVYFLCVAITPFIARPFAPYFDWVGYSMLRDMFADIFTILFWGVEALGFLFLTKFWQIRKRAKMQTEEIQETQDGETLETRKKKKKRECKPPMPLLNLYIITGICVGCILLVSFVIGFKVKPFYDIGEKVTGHQLSNRIAAIARNVAKCGWIVGMLKASKGMADEIAKAYLHGKAAWLTWIVAGSILMFFGLFDIFTSVVCFPNYGFGYGVSAGDWWMILTYLVFYAAFTAFYKFTEERTAKTYWLVMFIYIF